LAEKLSKTVSEIEHHMSNQELLEWHIYFDPDHWRKKVSFHQTQQSSADSKSQAILQLIVGKHG